MDTSLKICIVGGLGYLGAELTEILSVDHEVTVIDNNLFNNLRSLEEDSGVILLDTNLIKIPLPLNIFKNKDIIIFTSDIDYERFYTECPAELAEYNREYFEVVKHICKKFKCKKYYIHGDTKNKKSYKKYVDSIIELDGVKSIQCPELYGYNLKVRNDTFVNDIIKQFILYEQYLLEDNPLEVIEIHEVTSYAHKVCSYVLEDKDIEIIQILPRLMICNMIQWLFGKDYKLGISEEYGEAGDIQKEMIYFSGYGSFIYQIKLMTKAIEEGILKSFVDERFNNKYILDSAINSYDFCSKLLQE